MAKKSRPVLVACDTYIFGNGRVTELDRILGSPNTRKSSKKLLKDLDISPGLAGKKLRKTTWKNKSVDDLLAELGSD